MGHKRILFINGPWHGQRRSIREDAGHVSVSWRWEPDCVLMSKESIRGDRDDGFQIIQYRRIVLGKSFEEHEIFYTDQVIELPKNVADR